jgi:hypothetical protein
VGRDGCRVEEWRRRICMTKVHIEMGDARWRSGIPDGSISMETKSNSILPRLVIEHEEYWTNRPSPTEL